MVWFILGGTGSMFGPGWARSLSVLKKACSQGRNNEGALIGADRFLA